MPKRFPSTAQVERQGVALCASVVADMGHIWREKGVSDVGIDGEIELVDPTTRRALGRLLLVQSKAVAGSSSTKRRGRSPSGARRTTSTTGSPRLRRFCLSAHTLAISRRGSRMSRRGSRTTQNKNAHAGQLRQVG